MSCDDKPEGQAVYRITLQGRLDESWSGWFDGMAVAFEGENTCLSGPVADQSALRGILCKLWDLNLVLISVRRVENPGSRGGA